jgi:hypothetical protein
MSSLAAIVFKSGAAIEMPFEAAQLLEYFEENWDETAPELYVPVSKKGSGCRLVPSEVVGIFIAQADQDADEEEDEEGENDDEDHDEDDDNADGDQDDEIDGDDQTEPAKAD